MNPQMRAYESRNSGPRWNDKQAQSALTELEGRFGPAPLLLPTLPEQTPPPMGSFQ